MTTVTLYIAEHTFRANPCVCNQTLLSGLNEGLLILTSILSRDHLLTVHITTTPLDSYNAVHQCSILFQSSTTDTYNSRASLNNALQNMQRHDCAVHLENKFVKFSYTIEKSFDSFTFIHVTAPRLLPLHPVWLRSVLHR
jgi:hypothetical protein